MKKLTPDNIMFISLTIFSVALIVGLHIADKLGYLKQFEAFVR